LSQPASGNPARHWIEGLPGDRGERPVERLGAMRPHTSTKGAVMTNTGSRNAEKTSDARGATRLTIGVAVILFTLTGSSEGRPRPRFCSDTARALLDACREGVADDAAVRTAICVNIADPEARAACLDERQAARKEDRDLCAEQHDTRRDACTSLGEDRYDPDFSPSLFDDPKNPTNPNPYFPLTVGNHWEYHSTSNETDIVDVVNETKLIAGVGCIVARDVVSRDGHVAENTDDWYAHAKSGATWYFGEEVKDFEVFAGDDPQRPELVSIDGSFKAGRKG